MLHHFSNIILSEANNFIKTKLNLSQNDSPITITVLGNTPKDIQPSQGIFMRLVDITSVELQSNPNEYILQNQGFAIQKSPETFYIYFLFSTDYINANLIKNLEILSYIVEFFHNKSFFDIQNTPELQTMGISNFSVELIKLTPSEKHMLWQSLSIPYSPSLLYRVGFIFIGESYKGSNVVPIIEHNK